MISTMLSLALAATPVAMETRTVAIELRESERMIASPSLVVQLGAPATVATSGPDGYRLTVTVQQAGEAESYLVRSELYRPVESGWRLVGSPALVIAQGATARVSVGGGGEAGYDLGVTVR